MATKSLQSRDTIRRILQAFVDHVASSEAGSWFGDQRNQSNSVVDAEMLLTLLLPHAEIQLFSLKSPERTSRDMARLMHEMIAKEEDGREDERLRSQVNDQLVDLLMTFFDSHRDGDRPTFRVGSYAADPQGVALEGDSGPEIVDSYALSLTLCLRVLALVSDWGEFARTNDALPNPTWEDLNRKASLRLTAAMGGLLGSFAATSFATKDWEDKTGGRAWPGDAELDALRNRLTRLGVEKLPRSDAFECGWSWGPLPKHAVIAPEGAISSRLIQETTSVAWFAEAAPYLYFTVSALDSIADLSDPEVLSGGLLNEDQLILADRLRSLAEVSSSYWSHLAFAESDAGAWAIEDVPWLTSDGAGSDYWTLYVLRIIGDQIPPGEHALSRIIELLEELSQRARVTRKPFPPETDPAVSQLHTPGYQLDLSPADPADQRLSYSVLDFAPQLMKQAALLLRFQLSDTQRSRLLRLIGGIWSHLEERSRSGRSISWDYPQQVFSRRPGQHDSSRRIASWYFTERVVEALIAVEAGEATRPKSSEQLRSVAAAALAEAEWRASEAEIFSFDDTGPDLPRRLAEARQMLDDDPLAALAAAIEIGKIRLQRQLNLKIDAG